jgi:hypothetical protein
MIADNKKRSVHITIACDTILEWTPKELMENQGLLMDDNGRILSGIQMYNLAAQCKKDGFIVIPMCDNVDSRGYCQGHEIMEQQE